MDQNPAIIEWPNMSEAFKSQFYHEYKGFGVHNSECKVTIWIKDGFTFVLFTDLGKGTSVTNAAEQLVEEVYNEYLNHTPKDKVIFAETYEELPKENVDLVIPTWNGNRVTSVDWKHLGILIRNTK